VPHTGKANDKDNQREYRCPQCSFFCWLCRAAPKKPEIRNDDEDYDSDSDSGQSESKPSVKSKRSDGLIYMGPKDKRFEKLILRPNGIKLRFEHRLLQPEDLPDDGIQDDPAMASRAHLEIDHTAASEISHQFMYYYSHRYSEADLLSLVTHYLAPFDLYVSNNGPQTVVSLQKVRWKPRKRAPPVLSDRHFYDWDIRPDITYMVSSNLFENDLRRAIRHPSLRWLLADPHGVCPYLTIKLKRAKRSGKNSDARKEISVASTLWLSQRKILKDELKSSDHSDLKHYSIIINSTDYQILMTEFDGKVYRVRTIGSGILNRPEGVVQYAKWNNAIHKWGLGPNARSFKRDVEALRKKRRDEGAWTGSFTPPLLSPLLSHFP
jgi:hypothetical protein